MYGLKHQVDGEEGLPGNPEVMSSVRYTGRVLLAVAILLACVGFSGILRHGAVFFDAMCVLLLIAGAATLTYESEIQDRLSRWRR